jgi:hypothetical protein
MFCTKPPEVEDHVTSLRQAREAVIRDGLEAPAEFRLGKERAGQAQKSIPLVQYWKCPPLTVRPAVPRIQEQIQVGRGRRGRHALALNSPTMVVMIGETCLAFL